MLKSSFARPGAFCLGLLLLPILTFPTPAHHPSASPDLMVHEWGTFTSVSNKDGDAMTWRPLSVESDLPSFIHSLDKGESWRGLRYRTKSATPVKVRMETPVLYFYAAEETAASVKVDFPGGRITEWYPHARSVAAGIDWGEVNIVPNLRVELPHDQKENHYYPARKTDAAVLEVSKEDKSEYEKFLFYRGVGDFALPVSVKIQEGMVTVKNLSQEELGKAVLFENRNGQIGFSSFDPGQTEIAIDRPILGRQLGDLRQELRSMLLEHGLYEKEADAMLNTWRDSWFEDGLRIFYIVPRDETDKILPLTIKPQPSAVVRVLVGRSELITPEMENDVTAQLLKLNDGSMAIRSAAKKEINRYGRFVESILKQISSTTTDQRIQIAASALLEEMN